MRPVSPATSSFARAWLLAWPWIADALGAVALFVMLGGWLFLGAVLAP